MMHQQYFFIKKLTSELHKRLSGSILAACFSQNKEELVLRFYNENLDKETIIRADLNPETGLLSFPLVFHQSRSNSIALFSECTGKKVSAVIQCPYERCFYILFEEHYTLVFKLFGKQSNIVLLEKGKVIALFRNNLLGDQHFNIEQLTEKTPISREEYLQSSQSLVLLMPYLGGKWLKWLLQPDFDTLNRLEQWEILQKLISDFESTHDFYVCRVNSNPVLLLFKFGEVIKQFNNPIEAVNTFSAIYYKEYHLLHQKNILTTALQKQIALGKSSLAAAELRLKELAERIPRSHLADLLMANLHVETNGLSTLALPDFYTGKEMLIPIKKDLSLQKNAEMLYKKARNERFERTHLQSQISARQENLKKWEDGLDRLKDLQDVNLVNTMSDELIIKGHFNASGETSQPYLSFEMEGFSILVGRNDRGNELLTQRMAFKDDLWFHVKDAPGSHVLIKWKSGFNFPKRVIETAASLAAWYSKRKNETVVPVSCTPRKYVRKIKGMKTGAFKLEKETVLLVKPQPL